MQRPSETLTASIGSIIAAIGAILVGYGIEIPAGVEVAAVTLVAWIATGVTWYTAAKQRRGELSSAADGTVKP